MAHYALLTCGLFSVGTVVVALAPNDSAIAPPPREVPVAELVRQLGNPNFDEREAATKRLGRLPFDAPPLELLEALKSPNLEVRRRAGEAVGRIRENAELRALGRERAFAKQGKLDRFVVSAAAWDVAADDERLWQAVLDVAWGVSKRARFDWSAINSQPAITPNYFWGSARKGVRFIKTRAKCQPPFLDTGGEPILCAPGGYIAPSIVASNLMRSAVVVSEDVRVDRYIGGSMIIANGNVSLKRGSLSSTIVVCSGDVDVEEEILSSLVIARGEIRAKKSQQSILIAGGKVKMEKIVEVNERIPGLRNQIQESTRHPLGFVSFFELSDVGVEVEAAEGGLQVSRLIANGPMASAGVREGDVITKVGEHAVKTAEELRRRLRDASAVKGEAVLTLRRGATTLQRRVTIPD